MQQDATGHLPFRGARRGAALAVVVVSVALVLWRGCTPVEVGELATAEVQIGDDTFLVEVADTAAARAQGLMFRTSLSEDAGMLFVYDQASADCYWMLNTLIPLDIAFIRADQTISSVDTMTPQTTTLHCPEEPVLYALEVAAGQLAARGIGPGDEVVIGALP